MCPSPYNNNIKITEPHESGPGESLPPPSLGSPLHNLSHPPLSSCESGELGQLCTRFIPTEQVCGGNQVFPGVPIPQSECPNLPRPHDLSVRHDVVPTTLITPERNSASTQERYFSVNGFSRSVDPLPSHPPRDGPGTEKQVLILNPEKIRDHSPRGFHSSISQPFHHPQDLMPFQYFTKDNKRSPHQFYPCVSPSVSLHCTYLSFSLRIFPPYRALPSAPLCARPF